MTSSERYQYYKQNGLCPSCAKPNNNGKVLCNECSQKQKDRMKKNKDSGLCVHCGKPKEDSSKTMCNKCLSEKRKSEKWFKKHRTCVWCNKNPAAPNKVLCDECAERKAEKFQEEYWSMTEEERKEFNINRGKEIKRRKERRKKKGLCVKCSKPAIKGQTLCIECRIKNQRNITNWKIKNGMIKTPDECRWCSKKAIPDKKFCEEHYKIVCENLKKSMNHPNVIANREKLKQRMQAKYWPEMKYKGDKNAS